MNHRLTIRRMHNLYLAPKDHPAPEELRGRLDGMARNRLATACATALERGCDPRDRSIWYIRKLHFDISLDAGAASSDEIVRFWGAHLAASLARTIAKGPDGDAVIRFENPEEYVAQFVADIAHGRAWQRWYFRSFDSLRSLPAAAAIREALVRDPESAREVLQILARRGQLDPVLRVLSERDAEEILRACDTGIANTPEEMAAVLPVWDDAATPSPGHAALRLAVRAGFRAGRSFLRRFLLLVEILDRAASPLRRLPLAGDLAGVAALARESGEASIAAAVGVLLEATAGRSGPVAKVLQTLAEARAHRAGERQLFQSAHGSIFLLLPAMMECVPEEILDSAALRFMLFLKCLGVAPAPSMLHDPVLMLAAGFDSIPPAGTLQLDEASDAAVDSAVEAIFRAFTSHLLGFRESSIEFLRENFLRGVSTVCVDEESIDVELPPVPLRLVLRLAGVHEREYSVPWLGRRSVRLRLPGD